MIKKLLYCTLFALTIGTSWAKTFELPDGKPVISVTIPDAWKPEEIEAGVSAQSPDDGVFLSFESTKGEKGMDAIINSTFEMLGEHKVVLDKGSKETSKFKIAGQDAEQMLFSGKDEDGPAAVGITFVTFGENVFVITYWASLDKAKEHQPTINKIVNSIKELK